MSELKKPDSDDDKLPSSVRIFGICFIAFFVILGIGSLARIFLLKPETPAPIATQPPAAPVAPLVVAPIAPPPIPTPTKLIPQGEIPASEMEPELAKSLYTIINSKYACVKITSSKLVAKDATGIVVNLTCDYQDRYNLIILNKNPPSYTIYALTPDGKFK